MCQTDKENMEAISGEVSSTFYNFLTSQAGLLIIPAAALRRGLGMNTGSSQKTEARRILAPCDFSEGSYEAIDEAVRLAKQTHRPVTALFVADFIYQTRTGGPADWNQIRRELIGDARRKFQEFEGKYGDEVRLDLAIESGFAYQVIPNYASEHGYDLIVIGQQPHQWWQLFRRHTAERVLKKASVRVVVVDIGKERNESRIGAPEAIWSDLGQTT